MDTTIWEATMHSLVSCLYGDKVSLEDWMIECMTWFSDSTNWVSGMTTTKITYGPTFSSDWWMIWLLSHLNIYICICIEARLTDHNHNFSNSYFKTARKKMTTNIMMTRMKTPPMRVSCTRRSSSSSQLLCLRKAMLFLACSPNNVLNLIIISLILTTKGSTLWMLCVWLDCRLNLALRWVVNLRMGSWVGLAIDCCCTSPLVDRANERFRRGRRRVGDDEFCSSSMVDILRTMTDLPC